jgi:hypothetical protein
MDNIKIKTLKKSVVDDVVDHSLSQSEENKIDNLVLKFSKTQVKGMSTRTNRSNRSNKTLKHKGSYTLTYVFIAIIVVIVVSAASTIPGVGNAALVFKSKTLAMLGTSGILNIIDRFKTDILSFIEKFSKQSYSLMNNTNVFLVLMYSQSTNYIGKAVIKPIIRILTNATDSSLKLMHSQIDPKILKMFEFDSAQILKKINNYMVPSKIMVPSK